MSRIIVKHLPKNITEEKIRNLFGAKGVLTDVQLKYTPDGKFRQFCFIGYENEEDARNAVDYFDNSCIQTNRIKVEYCSSLGSEEKPRSWSKYAKDSKVNSEKKTDKIGNDMTIKKKTQNKTSKVDEIFGKYKEDPDFQEFIKAHDKTRVLWANDAEADTGKKLEKEEQRNTVNGSTEEVDSDKENPREKDLCNSSADESKLAEKSISDLDYMKSLISKPANKVKSQKEKKNNIDLFTIKMHNVPYKVKRQEIITFFKPLKPYSVRLPTKVRGFCYVGFKSEKDMAKAMLKNKSFIRGKQVFFSDFTEKNKVTKAKLEESAGGKVREEIKNPKWRVQEEQIRNEEDISESGKIFFRNLSYTVSEDDLQKLFEPFGPIADIHLPIDSITRKIKGFGTITYVMPEHAVIAFNKLDGTVFHGRLLHLIPGKSNDRNNEADSEDYSNLPFKQRKAIELKKASTNAATWNSLFLGPNAIAEILAKQFEMSKEKILDTNKGGSSAGVRLALGETKIVIEMKKFLEDHGVCLNAFEAPTKTKRSKTIILAKNLPADTTVAELTPIFGEFGPIGRIVLPPSGVTALIEFCDASEARQAFKKLAYSKFKNSPLYLEWAPENTFRMAPSGEPFVKLKSNTPEPTVNANEEKTQATENADIKTQEIAEMGISKTELIPIDESIDDEEPEPNTTLFLRNLNFKTVQDTVYNHFKHLGAIHTVQIAMKKDSDNPGSTTSLGYGFIQFKKQASAEKALKQMQLTKIDGNSIELKRSDRIIKSNSKTTKRKTVNITKQTGTKIMVRNIPFQATATEVRDIFKAFGLLRSLRLPLKMTPGEATHRGFGFVDFISKSDAKKAFEALSQSTHLYGRRLVLEWAEVTDSDVAEIRKRTAQNFSGAKETKRSKKAIFSMDAGDSGLVEEEENYM